MLVAKHACDFMSSCVNKSIKIAKETLEDTQGNMLIVEDAYRLRETENLSGVAFIAEGEELDEQAILTLEDFDPNWDRLSAARLNCKGQFKDHVGF